VREEPGSSIRLPVLVAVICTVCDVVDLGCWGSPLHDPRSWVVLVAVAAVDLALAAPPRFALAVALAHALVAPLATLLLLGLPASGLFGTAGSLVAAYLAGAFLSTGRALAALGALLAGLFTSWAIVGRAGAPGGLAVVLTLLLSSAVLPWLVGRYATQWRGRVAELQRREERRADDERAAIDRALVQERSALARDLHDGISHHVSGIAIHAGAARLALPDGPARRSVAAVELAGRAAMADLHRMLSLLHGADPAGRQPGIDNLDELLETVRAAGRPARLVTGGKAVAVPPSVDVAVYRVAQEALTNALRHGGPGPVEVVVHRHSEEVVLTVTNPVGPEGSAGHRRGLAGLRTRVALFGGSVAAGPGPDGRDWVLRAVLPLGERP
jgi:signal transduction histidine kinase